MKTLRVLAINLLTAAIFLVLLEVVCRMVLKKIYNRDFDSALIVDNKFLNSAGLKANAEGKVWGKMFHTDEFGCRKNAGRSDSKKKKWLFIGDSVTEGVGVDDRSTFASMVHNANDSFNVMNYSLIGYSDADYLNVLRVLLGNTDTSIGRVNIFFCLNDVYGSAGIDQLPVMARQNWIGKLNGFLQKDYATYKLFKLFAYQNSERYFEYDLQFYNKDDRHFMEAMNILYQCDLICKMHGVELDVVMLPYKSQIIAGRTNNLEPQSLVAAFCLNNRINFLDASGSLSREDPSSLYLFADEIHFSEEGHRAIAAFILSH